MWSSRLFWKLFLAYTTLNLAATITFVVIVSGWQEEQVVRQVRERLRDSAILIRSDTQGEFAEGRTDVLQSHIKRLGREIETRITLVAMDGHVLADSEQEKLSDVAAMENHKDRVELLQAATSGEGTSERISPTLDEPMLYFALRADRDGQPSGLIRTALPMTDVNRQINAIRRLIWLVAVLVSVGVLAVTYLVVARMVEPIVTLTAAAESIASGRYDQNVYASNRDEVGALARSFNRMSDQLESREAQLREINHRLSAVLGGMVEGVIAVDDRDRIVLANSAAGKLTGFSTEDAEGRQLLETVRNHQLQQAVTETRAAGQPQHLEIEFGENKERVVAVNSALLPGDPSSRVVLVLHDVSEIRRLELLRQEFVANVSHELKTPLSSIKAYAETLSGGAINDTERNLEFVQCIEEQAERLYVLILDLISLARIESGRQTFDIESVAVQDVVDSCLASQQALADAKNVSLETGAEAPGLHVRADEEGLKQILNNLIDNGIKNTPDGGRVSVCWREADTAAIIEVRDTGIGIPAEHLPRVFERFYRVDKARSREMGGTGLGLAIVKHLTQSFGGSVSVQSQPGEGSTFTIRLPLE